MNIGILGTGAVGEAIGTALLKKGHNVHMGSRNAGNEKAKAWVDKAGNGAAEGDFEESTLFGEVVFLCLNGAHALDALKRVNPVNLEGKIVVDITNPLDFTQGMPPRILEGYHNHSLGERIQEALPGAFVVKALNTVNYKVMVDARIVNHGAHNLFICGNDLNAKNQVKHLLVDNFHWKADSLLDLGGIEASRAIEAIVPFWVLVWQKLDTPLFNFKVVR
jgi:8-hydroxy-5-deazaflavin:NADPH oxidoreductase